MIKLRKLLAEYSTIQTIPTAIAQTYDLDGTVEKVVFTFNSAMRNALNGGFSDLDPHHFEISNGIITSDSSIKVDLHALLKTPRSKQVVIDPLKRVGYKVNCKNDFIKFIPIKSPNPIKRLG